MIDVEDLVPLARKALERRVTREQALRAAMRDGTAVQVAGRWFVRPHPAERPGSGPTER